MATADANGRFEVLYQDLPAGGPYVIRVSNEAGEHLEVQQVYVGDVFVCGGQSNMELQMRRVRERFPEEFWNGGAADVHLYKVQEYYDFRAPLEDHVTAGWTVCTAENLSEISAFSYFLGKELAELRHVPVGIINLSLGGTPVEAWMSLEGLKPWPDELKQRRIFQDESFRANLMAGKEQEERDWYGEVVRQEHAWPDDTIPWKTLTIPGYLSDAGLVDFCGCIWLRRTFEVAPECAGREALLRFGTLTDSDQIYINGVLVGETGYCYPPRRYTIPEGVLTAGENEIRIRLICRNGGGRATMGKPYEILWENVCSDSYVPQEKLPAAIRLDGQWEYQVRAVCGHAPEQEFINRRPTGLFQGMVAPCLPYTVSGAVWYQGESNDSHPDNYGELLRAMIADWRNQWQQEQLPFVIVQLPNCGVDVAGGDAWPKIRAAQCAAQELDQVAMTVNIDIGEDNDLHPLDKKTAAHRAVLALRSMVYGEDVCWKGPELSGCTISGENVCLNFETGDGSDVMLAERGTVPGSVSSCLLYTGHLFELAGADGVYYPAEVSICGKTVTLHAPRVQEPWYVRYAWSQAPGKVLLYQENGLCAGPFSRMVFA
jgi:sialate O-acetylesterase